MSVLSFIVRVNHNVPSVLLSVTSASYCLNISCEMKNPTPPEPLIALPDRAVRLWPNHWHPSTEKYRHCTNVSHIKHIYLTHAYLFRYRNQSMRLAYILIATVLGANTSPAVLQVRKCPRQSPDVRLHIPHLSRTISLDIHVWETIPIFQVLFLTHNVPEVIIRLQDHWYGSRFVQSFGRPIPSGGGDICSQLYPSKCLMTFIK